jgi:plasmid stability protein
MATLTRKGLPADVHRRIEARAARHGRSLNGEAIACLRAAVSIEPVDVDALLARARAHRESVQARIADEDARSITLVTGDREVLEAFPKVALGPEAFLAS